MIGIVNYGMGNIASVYNALEHMGAKCGIITSPWEIKKYDKLIVPGVGAFGQAVANIKKIGYLEELNEFVYTLEKPILGICLGMQLLLSESFEFGRHEGFRFINGQVLSFKEKNEKLRIPHVGWNTLNNCDDCTLTNNIQDKTFYFVHSYYCDICDEGVLVGTTEYGIQFQSYVEKKNVFGTQFHPEKSQKSGLQILENFNAI